MTVVSPVKRIENKSLDALEKSFINTIKKRGPRMESLGTPCDIYILFLIYYNCYTQQVEIYLLNNF